MTSTMGSAGEYHVIPSTFGTARYAGAEYAELPVNRSIFFRLLSRNIFRAYAEKPS